MNPLIQLYAELSDITREVCKTCEPPFKCCSEIGCFRARWWAKHAWGADLERTSIYIDKPYLTQTGCTVAPHMRPVCTFHLCNDKERPPRYQELMAEIAKLEAERFK